MKKHFNTGFYLVVFIGVVVSLIIYNIVVHGIVV